MIAVLASCSSPNPHPITQTEYKNADTGILVVSVKNGCIFLSPTRNTKYCIRSKDKKIDFMAAYDTATSKECIMDCALIDFFNIPAGEYEIYSWRSLKTTLSSGWREKPKNEFSIPFSVEAGKVNYLGQILLDNDYSISFQDMKERDIPVLHVSYPSTQHLEVTNPIKFGLRRPNNDEIEVISKSQTIYTPAAATKR